MNILFLTQIPPYPLDAGPKVRIYYVLRYLAQRHRVTLLSFVRNEVEERAAAHLRSFLPEVHTVPIKRSRVRDAFFWGASWLQGQPFLIVRDSVEEMHQTMARLTARQRFDAIHADQLSMAQYAVAFPHQRVLDQHNAVWTIVYRLWQNERTIWRRWLMRHEWQALQKYEAHICHRFDHILTVTEEDRRALESLDGQRPLPITVMPICIDPDEVPRIERVAQPRHIICIGGMFYPPNVDGIVWFARQVLPHVQAVCPDSQLFVVGGRPAPAFRALARENERIQVTGYVADPTPLLRESAVFIVPLRAGGGMRVKILDAWAWGIPVVSTTIGCEGIAVSNAENMLIADEPRAFAEAVIRLIHDPDLGQRLAQAGRSWVEQHYHWRTVYQLLDQIYPPTGLTG